MSELLLPMAVWKNLVMTKIRFSGNYCGGARDLIPGRLEESRKDENTNIMVVAEAHSIIESLHRLTVLTNYVCLKNIF